MIACVVLAAGGSRRLGTPKQLVTFNGRPLVCGAVAACADNGRVAVVVGSNADAVRAAVGGEGSMEQVPCIPNDDWEEGMASSIRTAARWARMIEAEALLLHLVDQPLIGQPHIRALVMAYRKGAPLVGTRYDEQGQKEVIGAPAIFDARFYDELLALRGDRGAAGILRGNAETVAIPFAGAAIDVDTPEDVQRLLASSPNAIRR